MFTRIALAHPTVHLTFRSGGKVLHDLPAVTGVKERIGVFFGRELADSLLWVESQYDQTHLWGYVAHPSQSRSSTKSQFLFLGGRYVRDRSLGHGRSARTGAGASPLPLPNRRPTSTSSPLPRSPSRPRHLPSRARGPSTSVTCRSRRSRSTTATWWPRRPTAWW